MIGQASSGGCYAVLVEDNETDLFAHPLVEDDETDLFAHLGGTTDVADGRRWMGCAEGGEGTLTGSSVIVLGTGGAARGSGHPRLVTGRPYGTRGWRDALIDN
jgi:hypothetical protein